MGVLNYCYRIVGVLNYSAQFMGVPNYCGFRLNVNADSGIVNTDSGFTRKVFTFSRNRCSH